MITSTLIIVAAVIGVIGLLAVLFMMFYKRSTKEVSFVRTGFGGERVFMDNGGFVFPVLHDVIEVNMKTLKIVIKRGDTQSLRTRDRIKINVNSEFFLRVAPDFESISRAAQTLGSKTMDSDELKEQVEGRCDDALRRAAVLMSLEEMNDKRSEFGLNVEDGVKVDLEKMGLMLESVALTQLNQTSLEYFDAENAFDVQGRTYVMEKVAENEKKQNEVENNKIVAIQKGDLDATNKKLELERQAAQAEQEQQLSIAQVKFETERKIEEVRIQTEIDLEEAKRVQSLRFAEAEKSVAEAQIDADKTKALAMTKREEIITAQEKAEADRNRIVEVISAEKEADRQRIFANAHADAEIREAEAAKVRFKVEAEGKTALNKAANEMSTEQVALSVKTKIVQQLPEIIRESVKPMENIDGIKIMQVDGFSNVTSKGGSAGGGAVGGAATGSGSGGSGGNLADQVVDGALRYRAQAPMVETLLNEIGLHGSGIKDFTKSLEREIQPDGKDDATPVLGEDGTGVFSFGALDDQPEMESDLPSER
ncbi:band 7 protein [Leucothrix sargassi]|nr:band 7 protein [Leucothrix sargassi]